MTSVTVPDFERHADEQRIPSVEEHLGAVNKRVVSHPNASPARHPRRQTESRRKTSKFSIRAPSSYEMIKAAFFVDGPTRP